MYYNIYMYAYRCICVYNCIYNINVIIIYYNYCIGKLSRNTIKSDSDVDFYSTIYIFNLFIPAQYGSSDTYFRWK